MSWLQDRRMLLALAGGALALVAGLLVAVLIMRTGQGDEGPPPASQGGLVVETRPVEDRLDAARPLRCFVAGEFVGELTLAECASRNGVATGALDVGLDESGALAAAGEAGTVLTPLPPAESRAEPGSPSTASPAAPPAAPATTAPTAATGAPTGACWRYAGTEWRRIGDLTLNACVQALFSGQCERPGGATYGRWMQQTLRLVPGRVEISGDNRRFRTLVRQGPGCSVPPIS